METSRREGQTDIFSMLSDEERQMPSLALPHIEPATLLARLQWEKEYLGLYVSGHPLQGLGAYFAKKTNAIRTLNTKMVGHRMKIGGLITHAKKISTKSGSNMMYLTVEDPSGRIEVTVFPKTYVTFKEILIPDTVVVMTGRLEERSGEMKFLCEEVKKIALEQMIDRAKAEGFFDEKERIRRSVPQKIEQEEEVYTIKVPADAQIETLEKIKSLLQENKGEDPVEIHITNGRTLKRIKVPFGIRLDRELKYAIRELMK
ncbi:hypothetical protein HZA41_00835, partial [Candidatus Peregrinibacteria bacterium]|nr:hypothetical protein [Candidatus Peregrinibacteria bacterium]